MKKISSVIVIVFTLCIPYSMAVTPNEFSLQEIEVTGVQIKNHTDSVEVIARITSEEIAHLPISNVADVLAFLPSIDVRSRGASQTQTDISMCGGTFDQVVVLLNGVSLSDAQTGHYTMNLPISPALIERIEVMQGVDVTGALSGAINIITRKTNHDAYSLQLSAGMNGYVHPTFVGSWRRGETYVNTGIEYARSDGYYAPTDEMKEQTALQNTDYQLANLYVQTRWRGLDAQIGAQYKDAALGTGYGYASTDQFDATRTMFASAQYEHLLHENWSLHSMLAYRGQYDRYEWHRGTPLNRHWTHNTQAAFDADYHWGLFTKATTRFGAEFRDEYIRSTNMGEHNRWQATLRVKQQVEWNHLTASLSIAGHYNNWSGWYGSGSAQIAYNFHHRGNIYLNANRSLRMPTWTDLYYKAGVQRGSADLNAEKAWQLALGAQYTWQWKNAGQLHISADAYYRLGTDIIDWNYNETDSLFHATNQNKLNTFGVELAVDYHLNKWLRNLSVRYAYTNLSIDLTQTKSNYLDHLRHKVSLNIDHGFYVWSKGCVGANWSLRWQDRAGTYVDIYGKAGNAFTTVLLLDGNIYIELTHARVALECTNMTNRHYYDYGGILMPGANGKICITANL